MNIEENIDDPDSSRFSVYLERPYFALGKRGGYITSGMQINMFTQKSISFSKGYVIKKHIVNRKKPTKDKEGEAPAEASEPDEDADLNLDAQN